MRFSRQEYGNRLPPPPIGDLPDPGIEPGSLTSPALAGGFFITSLTDVERSFCNVLTSLSKYIDTHTDTVSIQVLIHLCLAKHLGKYVQGTCIPFLDLYLTFKKKTKTNFCLKVDWLMT